MSNLSDKITYEYIKHVKKWIFCPICGDKMKINKQTQKWECDNCNYSISVEEFGDDYVLWFCDKCNAYLNIQRDFNKNNETWKCALCGYVNDISINNID